MVDHPERGSSPFTQVEMRRLWTYSDGALTAKGYRLPSGTARAGSWILVDQATGNVQGVVPPEEFSRRFRPVDLFADVPGLATYLGAVTASDGTAWCIWSLIVTNFPEGRNGAGPPAFMPRSRPSPAPSASWSAACSPPTPLGAGR